MIFITDIIKAILNSMAFYFVKKSTCYHGIVNNLKEFIVFFVVEQDRFFMQLSSSLFHHTIRNSSFVSLQINFYETFSFTFF